MTRKSSSSPEPATEIESSYRPGSAHASPHPSPLSPLSSSSSSTSPLTTYSNNDREHLHHRLHTLPPSPAFQSRSSALAISNQQYCNNNSKCSQDVPRPCVNTSALTSSTATRHGPSSNNSLDHSSSPSNNVSLTPANSVALQQLANHYGIPSVLPKPPLSKPATHIQQIQSTRSPPPLPDFQSQLSNYLSMLAQKPDSNSTSNTQMPNNTVDAPARDAPLMDNDANEAMHSVVQTLMASPEFTMQGVMDSPALTSPNSFLTSPFDTPNHQFDTSPLIDFADTFGDTSPMDTPLFDEFNTSPIDDSPFLDALSTPVMDGVDGMEMYVNGSPLFDDGGVSMYRDFEETLKPPTVPEVEWDKLLKMSPHTPSLDPTLVYPSPSLQCEKSFPPSVRSVSAMSAPGASVAPANRRKQPGATGTRRNITPQSLVPHDAPTQPRRYIIPSATSKKEVPATFARKKRKAVGGAVFIGEDELDCDADLPPLKPDATEVEQIEYKRRQNTLAARKSRKRKLEHQQGLESENEALKSQVEVWKTRCEVLSGMLKGAGIHVDVQDLGNSK